MPGFDANLFNHNLKIGNLAGAKRQIDDILSIEPIQAQHLCQHILSRKEFGLADSILAHKLIPNHLNTSQLQQLACINLTCAELLLGNPNLMKMAGYQFVETLLDRYPKLNKDLMKDYWPYYSIETILKLTKSDAILLEQYLAWFLFSASPLNLDTQHHTTIQVLLHADKVTLFTSLSQIPVTPLFSELILSINSTRITAIQTNFYLWICDYHLSKLSQKALLHLLELHPISSQKILFNQDCLNTLFEPPYEPRKISTLLTASVFYHPVVLLNLLRSPVHIVMPSHSIKTVLNKLCTYLSHRNHSSIDIYFLFDLAIFLQQLKNKQDKIKEHENLGNQEFEEFELIGSSPKETAYIHFFITNFHAALQSRWRHPEQKTYSFEQLIIYIAREIPFENRVTVLKNIEAYCQQAQLKADPKSLEYQSIYKLVQKVHATDVYKVLEQKIPLVLKQSKKMLEHYQPLLLQLNLDESIANFIATCQDPITLLDLLFILLKKGDSLLSDITTALSIKDSLFKEVETLRTERKMICQQARFIVDVSPKLYANPIMHWAYLFYSEYQWRAGELGILLPAFFPENFNYCFFNDEGNLNYARLLLIGAQKQNIIPLHFLKKKAQRKITGATSYAYENPWHTMLKQALSHAKLSFQQKPSPESKMLMETITEALQQYPEFLDEKNGPQIHQSLKDEVKKHFELNPHLCKQEKKPIPAVEPDLLDFSIIQMPGAPPPITHAMGILRDHSDELMETAETEIEKWAKTADKKNWRHPHIS